MGSEGHALMFPLLLLVLILLTTQSFATEVTGPALVVDGDTVEVGSIKIRLQGIDAPETDQVCLDQKSERWNCGVVARDELRKHTAVAPWKCSGTAKDRFGRLIATCEVNGENVNRWMVRNGWAMSFVRFSHVYDAEENDARKEKVGLWSGAFIKPWDWRNRAKDTLIVGSHSVPLDAEKKLLEPLSSAGAPSPNCNIKGNVNRSGACIYHAPGSRYYAKINMELNGKRWFCSTQEAETAGCRATRR